MCSSRLTYTLLQNSEAALSIKMKTTLKITQCGSKKDSGFLGDYVKLINFGNFFFKSLH